MTRDEIVSAMSSLQALLECERRAIRQVDSAALTRLGDEKEALMTRLSQGLAAGSADAFITRELERLRASLQHNLLLLVHARACLRGAIEAATAGSITYDAGGRQGLSGSARLSVTG
jgi:hypothetical protein